MGLFATLFSYRSKNTERHHGVFYKIVDFSPELDKYTLQCINTSAIFQATITEIVFDKNLLYRLHPIQACYLGIEYAKSFRNAMVFPGCQPQKVAQDLVCARGNNVSFHQDRQGRIFFINQITKAECVMDPRDIALSKELIQEFDVEQAFHIGLLAGLKINTSTQKEKGMDKILKHTPLLRIIK